MEVEQATPVGVEDQQITVADVAAQPAMVPETSPRPPDVPLRELRLALVCYGGVSLAIYMHGVTKEFERLVAASVAYERDQTRHDFAADDTAAVYWTLLQQLEQQPELWDEARRVAASKQRRCARRSSSTSCRGRRRAGSTACSSPRRSPATAPSTHCRRCG